MRARARVIAKEVGTAGRGWIHVKVTGTRSLKALRGEGGGKDRIKSGFGSSGPEGC